MKDVATPVPQNEVRAVIKKSLENAALVNYERLSEEARIEGEYRPKNQINDHFTNIKGESRHINDMKDMIKTISKIIILQMHTHQTMPHKYPAWEVMRLASI